jgi:hypothetical protein
MYLWIVAVKCKRFTQAYLPSIKARLAAINVQAVVI